MIKINLDGYNSKNEVEEDVDNHDVDDVLDGVDHTIKDSLNIGEELKHKRIFLPVLDTK